MGANGWAAAAPQQQPYQPAHQQPAYQQPAYQQPTYQQPVYQPAYLQQAAVEASEDFSDAGVASL